MATTLRPSALDDFGMCIALERLCEDYEKMHEIRIAFTKNDTRHDHYPSEIEIAIYRIAQEALSNIMKHASTQSAAVSFTETDHTLILEIEDNGIGIDEKKARSRKTDNTGMGLLSMKERANLLGGSMQITSSPGKGTKLRVEIPFTSEKP
jgi:signal transduction histidine kinase